MIIMAKENNKYNNKKTNKLSPVLLHLSANNGIVFKSDSVHIKENNIAELLPGQTIIAEYDLDFQDKYDIVSINGTNNISLPYELSYDMVSENHGFISVHGTYVYKPIKDISTILTEENLIEGPIPYTEFKKIGMTEYGFMEYLALMEELRGILLLSSSRYGLSCRYMHRENEILMLVKEATFNLLSFLNNFSNKCLSIDGYFLMFDTYPCLDITYNFYEPDYQLCYPIHIDIKRFRQYIEKHIKIKLTTNVPHIKFWDANGDNSSYSLDELETILSKKSKMKKDLDNHVNWASLTTPEIPDILNEESIYAFYDQVDDYNRIQQYYRDLDIIDEDELNQEIAEIQLAIKEKTFFLQKNTLYIHKGNIICQRNKHRIESISALVPTMEHDNVRINVNYCNDCNRYFINEDEYLHYRKLYDILLIKLSFTADGTYDSIANMQLAEQSPLNLCGYNVNQVSDYSSEFRHSMLKQIIESGILTKSEVMDYLNHFIKMNGRKKSNSIAVSKWENDLEYVRNYQMDNQRKVNIDKIKNYR